MCYFLLTRSRRDPLMPTAFLFLVLCRFLSLLRFFFAQNRELVILATEALSVRKERALQKVYSEMTYPKHTNISRWSLLSSCILSMLSAQYLT